MYTSYIHTYIHTYIQIYGINQAAATLHVMLGTMVSLDEDDPNATVIDEAEDSTRKHDTAQPSPNEVLCSTRTYKPSLAPCLHPCSLLHVSNITSSIFVAVEYMYKSMLQRVHDKKTMLLQTCEQEVRQLVEQFPQDLGKLTGLYLKSHKREVLIPHTRALLEFMRTVVDRSFN